MAELLARGYITIAAVSDGYSLSLTAASVSIPANHDGSNPDLEYAETTVTLQKGNDAVAFDVVNVIPSADGIQYTYKNAGECAWKVAIIGLSSSISSGYLDIQVRTKDGKYESSVKFSFSVVKNTVGVDWIEEWDGTHNQIGENYVVTPKLFAGHKSSDGKITGVYLGKLKGFIGEVFPFTLADAEEGIYGYRDNKIVFYINNYGAKIGGWDITPGSIQCEDGTLTIKSEGTISSQSDGKTHWSLNKDGSASFANGKVAMDAAGNASFEGKITAASGSIAGWSINKNSLFKGGLSLNVEKKFFAIAHTVDDLTSGSLQLDKVKSVGGVAMFYTSDADYGFIAYKGDKLMFSVGTNNNIAGWNFDENSIYIGTKNNNVDQYTNDTNSLTIGTNGMRGKSWFINMNGSVSFSSGYATFKEKSGAIGKWNFDSEVFYIGTKNDVSGQFTSNSSSITLGPKGLRGYKWRLEGNGAGAFCGGFVSFNSDGSGSLANGNISWDKSGNVSFSDAVKLTWQTEINNVSKQYKDLMGTYLTHIDSDGIYTGTLAADKIAAGTISACTIQNAAKSPTWKLYSDGSGSLANGSISWDKSGSITFTNAVVLAWSKPYIDDANTSATAAKNAASSASSSASSAASSASSASSAASSASSAASSSAASKKAAEEAAAKAAAVGADVDKKYANLIGSKFTYIDANGIYTGTLVADQVSGLACTFVKGSIGGWNIGSNSISKNSVTLGSDGTISNGSYWSLKNDGSGSLAKGNISWTNNGTLSVQGNINATSGSIGKWYILNGVITSDNTGAATNFVKLDSANRKITIQTTGSSYNDGSYDYMLNSGFGAVLTLDGSNGIIQACAKNSPTYSTATSYLSSNGIFSNIAGINGMPASSGYTQRGAVVGLGFANVNKNAWSMDADEVVVAGVYGRASNSGTAAAYGGFFYQLKACGLTTSVFYFTDSKSGTQLPIDKTTVIGLINSKKTYTLYLPKNAHEGQEVEIIQMGAGCTRIDTNDGTHIYDDTSENEYYDCPEGWVTICKRVRYAINNVNYDIWAVHQYKFK